MNTEGEGKEIPGSTFAFLLTMCDGCRFASTVAFHPDGNCIGVGTSDNVVKVGGVTSQVYEH